MNQKELKSRLHYDPKTGLWTWLNGQRKGLRAGFICKPLRSAPRWAICLNERHFIATRLACLYMTGKWPKNEMDHINRNALDDRWENLRDITRYENEINKSAYRNNKLGIKGVYFQDGRFRASIRRRGERVHLGLFVTAEEAARAYEAAARAA